MSSPAFALLLSATSAATAPAGERVALRVFERGPACIAPATDLQKATWPTSASPRDEPIVLSIRRGGNDGTEVDAESWLENGVHRGTNRMGRNENGSYVLGLRFDGGELRRGQRFHFARLVIPAAGFGRVDGRLDLRIAGLDADGIGPFQSRRPSAYPRTAMPTAWPLTARWPGLAVQDRTRCVSFRRNTPDIAPAINAILARPGWGSGVHGRTLGLVVEEANGGDGFVSVEDDSSQPLKCRGDKSIKLELYPTVRSTFVGKELLGRPTDRSVTVNAHSLIPVDVYFEYGLRTGDYRVRTASRGYAANEEIEVDLSGLEPNTRYVYRMRYRRAGAARFEAGPERTFHTQRARGERFSFVVQSDPHLQGILRDSNRRAARLYATTMSNAAAVRPDFMIDLGDTFHTQYYAGRDALDQAEAIDRHIDHRAYFDRIGHSTPLFLVIGNHEGEQGWRLDGTAGNLAVWATQARKMLYPNPVPNGFYASVGAAEPFIGLRESVYAFEWGDVLFVAIDPYWYTRRNPHPKKHTGDKGDAWRWTLGHEQYAWLRHVLESSSARYKILLTHQLTSSFDRRKPYGRGGIRIVSHAIYGRGSYEWGGEGPTGAHEFDLYRPGWQAPIHRLLVDNDVSMVLHGHDHCFAREELDHIVYQEVGSPNDATYGAGFCIKGRIYDPRVVIANPGHLRVTVTPRRLVVDTVRTAEGGGVAVQSYSVWDCNQNGVVDGREIANDPSLDGDGDGRLDRCRPRPDGAKVVRATMPSAPAGSPSPSAPSHKLQPVR